MSDDICRLCLKESELRYSHILPEFFYSELYDELHRALALSNESEKKIQKGMREYLLCQKCETQLSRYEGYAIRIIRNIHNFNRDANLDFIHLNINKKQGKLKQTLDQEVAYAYPANGIYHDPGSL